MDHYEELNLEAINTEPLAERPSKVHINDFASVCPPQANVGSFINSLPDILAGRDMDDLKTIAADCAARGAPLAEPMAFAAREPKTFTPIFARARGRGDAERRGFCRINAAAGRNRRRSRTG